MRFSIKAKTLLLFVSIPLVSLGCFLFASQRLFESDKKAYVFSASYNEARAMADQIQTWIDGQLLVLKSLAFFYDFGAQKVSSSGQQYFDVSKQVRYFGVYEQGEDGQWKKHDSLERVPEIEGKILEKNSLASLAESGAETITRASIEIGSFVVASVADVSGRKFLFLAEMHSDRIQGLLTEGGQAQRIFWSEDLKTLWAEKEEEAKAFLTQVRSVNEMQDGSFEVPGLAFVSVVSLQPLPFSILSSVRIDQAMKAKEALLRDSLFLAMGLIGLILIIGVVSANHLTHPLLTLREAVMEVATGKFGVQAEVKSHDEIGELASGFNTMSDKLKNLVDSEISKARMEKELETAQAVQEGLFPNSPVETKDLKAFAYYAAASECGGDLWQYFETPKSYHFIVGDVTGHGAASSLITSAIVGCIHSLKETDPAPNYALSKINDAIFSVARGRMQATLFWARIEKGSFEMTFGNAGHDSMVLRDKTFFEGKGTWKDLVQLQGPTSKRIGESPGAEYVLEKHQLMRGDLFLLYTDGIFMRLGPKGEFIKESEWIRMLAKMFKEKPNVEAIAAEITHLSKTLPKDHTQEDDLTWVLVQL